eukprot:jgi/Psemu1/35807/gm1.35807_g
MDGVGYRRQGRLWKKNNGTGFALDAAVALHANTQLRAFLHFWGSGPYPLHFWSTRLGTNNTTNDHSSLGTPDPPPLEYMHNYPSDRLDAHINHAIKLYHHSTSWVDFIRTI